MIHKFKTFEQKLLPISLGIVYLWFGALKFFPGLSPAEDLAIHTINGLTFELIPSHISILLLATWEVSIGIAFILGYRKRLVIIAAMIHMVCTFTPLLLFPELSFNHHLFSLSLVGQYIIKTW